MLQLNDEEQPSNSCSEDSTSDQQKSIPMHVNSDSKEHTLKSVVNNVADKSSSKEQEKGNGDESDVENVESVNSKSSSIGIELAATCSESMPSSDSNKENLDSNTLPLTYPEFDPSDYISFGESGIGEYENTDLIPLPQLLKMHVKHLVSGFEFGEATQRRAQENMKTARDKKKNENQKSADLTTTIEKDGDESNQPDNPCCSKTLSEIDHKTPHSRKRQRLGESKINMISSDEDFCKATRRVPDSLIGHPDCIEVWVCMVHKEEASLQLRNPRLFNDFKSVTPRMRAILLDWLMEVAEVYHLRRVTYYLSVDYFDRFLSIRPDIPKSLLQLVGITCLYIAAKVEEIYPPNLSEFSYVCDGACRSKEMVSCELLILNSLGWEVVLTTPSDWLNLYMQLHFKSNDIVRTTLSMDFNKDFIFPQYSAYQFTRASQLIDLLSLDPGFLKFGYSVIAAAAMYYMYGEQIALAVSGLSWTQLKSCVDYMEVFYEIIKDAPDPRLRSCLGGPHPEEINRISTGLLNRIQRGPQNENYSFQTHVASMDYFEKATIYRLSRHTRQKVQDDNLEDVSNNNDVKSEVSVSNDVQSEECSVNKKDSEVNTTTNSVEDLTVLEELTKNEVCENSGLDGSSSEQNLLSLDEIFELILSQDEVKSTSSEQ